MRSNEKDDPPTTFSKRATRRLIQRAFVLAGRDKHLRQQIREAHLSTLWVVQDSNLSWTVLVDRARLNFERCPVKKPDLTFTFRSVEEFFQQAEEGISMERLFQLDGNPQLQRLAEPLLNCFFKSLRHVLANPVDDVGESLL